MQTILTTLLLIIFSLPLRAINVYFSPQDDLVNVVIQQIRQAQRTIDLSIYTFNSLKIRQELLHKLEAGVLLRIVVNKGNSTRVKEFISPLIKKGAQVRYVSKINHHKFFLIDNYLLYNSSGNMSDSPRQASYDENSFVCSNDCKRLVRSYRDEFNFLFHHAKSYIPRDIHNVYPRTATTNALFTTTNFTPVLKNGKVVFHRHKDLPRGNVVTALEQAIDSAHHHIQVATGHFRSWPLFKALVRAAKRGIQVELLIDSQEYTSQYISSKEREKVQTCVLQGKSEEFCSRRGVHFGRLAAQEGIMVKIKYYALRWFFPMAPQMHSKYMIIDDKILYTGSYNWSYNAEFNTFENIAIHHNQRVIKKYQKNFKKLFHLGPNFAQYMQTLATKEQLPLFFKPIALTVAEIDQLVQFYRTSCSDLYQNPQGTQFCNVD